MKKYIIITADTNDADYITRKTLITEEEIEGIKPVIEAIKNFKPYETNVDSYKRIHYNNYPTQDCCREDLGEKSATELYGHINGFELFDELCPCDEHGIHTIASIEIINILDEIRLL